LVPTAGGVGGFAWGGCGLSSANEAYENNATDAQANRKILRISSLN
jgi:hypothetical protein